VSIRTLVLRSSLSLVALTFVATAEAQERCVTRQPPDCSRIECRGGEIERGRSPTTPTRPTTRPCSPPAEAVVCCIPASSSPKAGTVKAPSADCVWRGTAPFCSGSCKSKEVRVGPSARTSPSQRVKSATEQAHARGLTTSGFGRTCLSGTKFLCCPRP
jgi:hypothetical protein